MFKRKLLLVSLFLTISLLFAEEIDLVGKNNYELPVLKNGETIGYDKIGTTNGFRLDLYGTHNNNKRVLGSFVYFSGWIQSCSDNILYFSLNNYKSSYYSAIYKYDANSGIIIKILDGLLFTASNDGRYICYCEPWQVSVKENHEESYWYIYDVVTQKQKVIINTKQENGWDVKGRPLFDEITKSFIIKLGYDDVEKKRISFNPYEILP